MTITSIKNQVQSDSLLAGNDYYFPGYESIATVTVDSGGSSNVTFSSIPQTYAHLQIRGLARITNVVSSGDADMRFNSDSGANYAHHHLYGNGASVSTPGTGTTTARIYASYGGMPGANTSTNAYSSFYIDILDYSNTNKYTTIRSLWGYDANGSGECSLNSGVWMNTAAVTSISFTGVTFSQYSHIALYGLRSA